MNFSNPSYDGKRGVLGDAYREFMPDGDLSSLIGLGEAFTKALAEVRGTAYSAKSGFSLYPTSGSNEDWAYSRHFTDPSKAKTLSYTLEWGTEFQPPWTEMENIIKDVSSGLLGLGLEALGFDSFIVANRDTFSSYELEATLSYPESFYAIYDGFAPSFLGVPATSPTISFVDANSGNAITSISASLTSTVLEDSGAPDTRQRILFTFEVDFVDDSAFNAETRDIIVEAYYFGMQDVAYMQLIRQPNPYMIDGPISWLSTDVRVFQLKPGGKVNPFSNVALGDPDANSDAPYRYVQGLLTELRGHGDIPTPVFEGITQDEQASQLELSRTVDGIRVLNFAVAKVRYRAKTQAATDVRVFFRTFNTMVSNLLIRDKVMSYHERIACRWCGEERFDFVRHAAQ
jgi:hypothetical protein